MSGSNFFVHGFRPLRDMDGIYIDGDLELDNLVKKFFFDKNTKFPFGDIGSENWNESWIEKNKRWYELLQVSGLNELILNPRYHYYFMGIKLLRIDHEVLKKMKISKNKYPRLFADIYNINLNTEIKLEEFGDNKKILELVKSYGNSFFIEFQKYLFDLYYIKL